VIDLFVEPRVDRLARRLVADLVEPVEQEPEQLARARAQRGAGLG
jgi:hypothetical protein